MQLCGASGPGCPSSCHTVSQEFMQCVCDSQLNGGCSAISVCFEKQGG
jgi:hypothetical protein